MPTITDVPVRVNPNAIVFDADEVREYADLLVQAAENENGVGMDGTFKSENIARTRGQRLRDLIEERYGVKPRVHVSGAGESYTTVLSIKGDDVTALDKALDAEDKALDAEDQPDQKTDADADPDA